MNGVSYRLRAYSWPVNDEDVEIESDLANIGGTFANCSRLRTRTRAHVGEDGVVLARLVAVFDFDCKNVQVYS